MEIVIQENAVSWTDILNTGTFILFSVLRHTGLPTFSSKLHYDRLLMS